MQGLQQHEQKQDNHVPDIGTLSILRRDATTACAYAAVPLFSAPTCTTTTTAAAANNNREDLLWTVRRIRGLEQSLQQQLAKKIKCQSLANINNNNNNNQDIANPIQSFLQLCEFVFDEFLTMVRTRLQGQVKDSLHLLFPTHKDQNNSITTTLATTTLSASHRDLKNDQASMVMMMMDPLFAKWLISNLTALENKVNSFSSCAVFDLSGDCRYLTFHYQQEVHHLPSGQQQHQQQEQVQQRLLSLCLDLSLSKTNKDKLREAVVSFFPENDDDDDDDEGDEGGVDDNDKDEHGSDENGDENDNDPKNPLAHAHQQSSTTTATTTTTVIHNKHAACRQNSKTKKRPRMTDSDNQPRRRNIDSERTTQQRADDKKDKESLFLVELYADFVARANQHAALFDELDDLDKNVRVLDPPPPPTMAMAMAMAMMPPSTLTSFGASSPSLSHRYSCRHRRIQLENDSSTESVLLTLSSHQPRAFPKRVRFLGGPKAIVWEQEFLRNAKSLWDVSCSVRQSLQKCLGGVNFPKPVMVADESQQPKQEHPAQNKVGGDSRDECGICFSEEHYFQEEPQDATTSAATTTTTTTTSSSSSGRGSTIVPTPSHLSKAVSNLLDCENPVCQKVYHHDCLREWLMSLPSSRESFGRIVGQCPYCKEAISVSLYY